MLHEGPLLAYLSRSPIQSSEGLKSYKADGDWFKVHQSVPFSDRSWFNYTNVTVNIAEVCFSILCSLCIIVLIKVIQIQNNFTLPATTPPGFYLLRSESLYPSTNFNSTQMY